MTFNISKVDKSRSCRPLEAWPQKLYSISPINYVSQTDRARFKGKDDTAITQFWWGVAKNL